MLSATNVISEKLKSRDSKQTVRRWIRSKLLPHQWMLWKGRENTTALCRNFIGKVPVSGTSLLPKKGVLIPHHLSTAGLKLAKNLIISLLILCMHIQISLHSYLSFFCSHQAAFQSCTGIFLCVTTLHISVLHTCELTAAWRASPWTDWNFI